MNYIDDTSFSGKELAQSYGDFWAWFESNSAVFLESVRRDSEITDTEESEGTAPGGLLQRIAERLAELEGKFFFLVGMLDEDTAELVITADGVVKRFVFVEELVRLAPEIPGWKFTALKPAIDMIDMFLKTERYSFSEGNLQFYIIDDPDYLDEVNLTMVHKDIEGEGELSGEEEEEELHRGAFLFLQNYLGELGFASAVDALRVIGVDGVENGIEPKPIAELKQVLLDRERDFVERNKATLYDTENDPYILLERELDNGRFTESIFNSALLNWDNKASHPWMLRIVISYDGEGSNGKPGQAESQLIDAFEEDLLEQLKCEEGYLNIGRETGDDMRLIFIACKEFRKSSFVVSALISQYAETLGVDYDIYRDKYWQSLEEYRPSADEV